jgi:hypothetical protein
MSRRCRRRRCCAAAPSIALQRAAAAAFSSHTTTVAHQPLKKQANVKRDPDGYRDEFLLQVQMGLAGWRAERLVV